MELVGERQIPDQPMTTPQGGGIAGLMAANQPGTATTARTTAPAPGSPQFQQEYMARLVWKNALLGNLNAMALVLGARLAVLLATCGAIFLAWLALGSSDHPDLSRTAVLGCYLVGCYVPVIWLAARK
jgi:hypothetical protein